MVSTQTENFILNLDVGVHGAGSVVRSFVLSIVTQKLVISFLRQGMYTVNVVKWSQDLKKKIIVVEGIIVIVKSGGKALALPI